MSSETPLAFDPLQDERFLRLAMREALLSADEGEVPIGCVIVKDGRILGRGHNRMEGLRDPTAHAEILAIGAACQALDNWRLEGCTLYVTLEPCPMCAGAILNSRVARVVYGARDKRLGALGSTFDILGENPINRVVTVDGPALEEECLEMLKGFFRDLRARKKQASPVSEERADAEALQEGFEDGLGGIAFGRDSE